MGYCELSWPQISLLVFTNTNNSCLAWGITALRSYCFKRDTLKNFVDAENRPHNQFNCHAWEQFLRLSVYPLQARVPVNFVKQLLICELLWILCPDTLELSHGSSDVFVHEWVHHREFLIFKKLYCSVLLKFHPRFVNEGSFFRQVENLSKFSSLTLCCICIALVIERVSLYSFEVERMTCSPNIVEWFVFMIYICEYTTVVLDFWCCITVVGPISLKGDFEYLSHLFLLYFSSLSNITWKIFKILHIILFKGSSSELLLGAHWEKTTMQW